MSERLANPSNLSYMTSGLTTLYGFTVNEWVVIVGLSLSVATFITNVVFKYLHYRLERKRSKSDVQRNT